MAVKQTPTLSEEYKLQVWDLRSSQRRRFEKIQVKVFWVVTLCGVTVGYQCFGGPCCLPLQHYIVSQPRRLQLG